MRQGYDVEAWLEEGLVDVLVPAGNAGTVFNQPKYPININNGCPGNVELQDVWMPAPPWSVGGRFNADGSAGTSATNYTEFGSVKLRFDGSKSVRVDYINSKDGASLDSFTIYK